MPLVRIEIALQALVDGRLCTLLVKRGEPPYKDRWALPGGVIRVDLDENLDAAARRVAGERLLSVPPNLRQLCAVGAAGREPRGPHEWGLSVVYRALGPQGAIEPQAGKRIRDLKWVPADEPLRAELVAFDHLALVAQAVATTRAEIAALQFPAGFVPPRFTLTELQTLCEQVLGTRLDKSSFRRKLAERELVRQVEGEFVRGGKNRPAAVFELA